MARRPQRPAPNRPAEWSFFTFPVAFALAIGLLLGPVLYYVTVGLSVWVALFAVSFGTAHIIGHSLRRRGLDKRIDQEEEAERERRALAARAARLESGEDLTPSPAARRRRRRRN